MTTRTCAPHPASTLEPTNIVLRSIRDLRYPPPSLHEPIYISELMGTPPSILSERLHNILSCPLPSFPSWQTTTDDQHIKCLLHLGCKLISSRMHTQRLGNTAVCRSASSSGSPQDFCTCILLLDQACSCYELDHCSSFPMEGRCLRYLLIRYWCKIKNWVRLQGIMQSKYLCIKRARDPLRIPTSSGLDSLPSLCV